MYMLLGCHFIFIIVMKIKWLYFRRLIRISYEADGLTKC